MRYRAARHMQGAGKPVEALLGGVSLGTLSVARLLNHGRILGISGNIRSLLKRAGDRSSAAFVTGLVLGGAILSVAAPCRFGKQKLPINSFRACLAGLLVGAGASLANGCTSGHGICGNARLSSRSLTFTALIIISGVVSARLFGTTRAFEATPLGFPRLQAPTLLSLLSGLTLLAASTTILKRVPSLLGRQRQADRHKAKGIGELDVSAAELFVEALEGLLFTLSLGYTDLLETDASLTGLTNPRDVVAFLTMTTSGFDYSLALVMGGAVLAAIVPFQRAKHAQNFVAANGRKLPETPGRLDWKLVLGSLAFGTGWGLAGLCPGPALAALPTLKPQILVFNAAAFSAMYLMP